MKDQNKVDMYVEGAVVEQVPGQGEESCISRMKSYRERMEAMALQRKSQEGELVL